MLRHHRCCGRPRRRRRRRRRRLQRLKQEDKRSTLSVARKTSNSWAIFFNVWAFAKKSSLKLKREVHFGNVRRSKPCRISIFDQGKKNSLYFYRKRLKSQVIEQPWNQFLTYRVVSSQGKLHHKYYEFYLSLFFLKTVTKMTITCALRQITTSL